MGIWEDLKAGKDITKTHSAKRRLGVETDAFIQNKLRDVIESDEKVLKTLVGRSDHSLILTDKKIVYLSGTTVYHTVYPYETIRNVRWTDKGYGTSVFNLETALGAKVLYGVSKTDASEAIKIINDHVGGEKVADKFEGGTYHPEAGAVATATSVFPEKISSKDLGKIFMS